MLHNLEIKLKDTEDVCTRPLWSTKVLSLEAYQITSYTIFWNDEI